MTKREEAIEGAARGIFVSFCKITRYGSDSDNRYWESSKEDFFEAATAAFDAALEVLGEPGEEMIWAGDVEMSVESHRMPGPDVIFRAMLATLARKED